MQNILEKTEIKASAPCRIDMGGTLDIKTLYYPLRHYSPCTFNLAIGLRTEIRLLPYKNGIIKVSSKGFDSVEYPLESAPFDHDLGLMFAIASYFNAQGVHILIDSSSPPRSALGGSSAAAVALVAAFSKICEYTGEPRFSKEKIAFLAHSIEESVAGVPCGFQDQLAAVYGGVNAWHWSATNDNPPYKREVIAEKSDFKKLEQNILLAYCGIPHESKDINSKWIKQFLTGKNRNIWNQIISWTQKFVHALSDGDIEEAAEYMKKETAARTQMTPNVFDSTGQMLVHAAEKNQCGARFTGAGGGGCIWAIGEVDQINRLTGVWEEILAPVNTACLLDLNIDEKGVTV